MSNWQKLYIFKELPCTSNGKESACNAGDLGLIPGWGTASGERNGSPLRSPCLENPMDGGAWRAIVRGVAQSQTRLSNGHCHYYIYLSCAAWCSHTHIHCWNVFQPGDELGDPHSQAKAEPHAQSVPAHWNILTMYTYSSPLEPLLKCTTMALTYPSPHIITICVCAYVFMRLCVCVENT